MPVHLWIPNSARKRDLKGLHQHRYTSLQIRSETHLLDHIPVTAASVALCQAGEFLDAKLLAHCLDDFDRQFSRKWLDETVDRFSGPGRRGLRPLLDILRDPRRVNGVTDSFMERQAADLANDPRLPAVVLQHRLEIDGRVYFLDVAIPLVRLGIEGHSREFHWGPIKTDEDNVRDHHIASIGWLLLYMTYHQVQDTERFLETVVRTVHTRAVQLGVTF